MKEEWKDIDGFIGLYQISNLGRVKSNHGVKQFLKPFLDPGGYPTVILCATNKRKTISIHRLLACQFIPNPENKPDVNHINSIRSDNRLENLEWCTEKENIVHCVRNGRFNAQYRKIRASKPTIDLETGIVFDSLKEACFQLGLNHSTERGRINYRHHQTRFAYI